MDKHGKELATGWCFGGNGFRQDPERDRSIHLFVTVLYSSSTARGHRLLGWGGVLEGNNSASSLMITKSMQQLCFKEARNMSFKKAHKTWNPSAFLSTGGHAVTFRDLAAPHRGQRSSV
jgi:hypothetical protein